MAGTLRHSPLDAAHRALGARMAKFGGWEMPIQYQGVIAEHLACRNDAVVFDVSHLGSVRVEGAGAEAVLQWSFTNDLRRIGPGRAQYTHLLDPDDGHVVDDIIVWWVADHEFLVMPNASNTRALLDALAALDAVGTPVAPGACDAVDITADRAVLAIQGPRARERVAEVLGDHARVARFAVQGLGNGAGWVAGTGYTGEDGIEVHVPAEEAGGLWRAVLDAGVVPAGLGARDTLRLEAGLPLHGHELGPGITPLQADLAWVVRFDKGAFRGRAALEAEREQGVHRRLRGLLAEGRHVPRPGYPVDTDGGARPAGVVTSGNFSPVLERGIALAFLPPDVPDGAAVTIDVRGRPVAATVVPTPFVPRSG